MNRVELQQLARDRVRDAEILLANGRWSAAYYLAGYALECALKSCVLAFVERTGAIFNDKRFSEKCWTHSVVDLLTLSDLQSAFGTARSANPVLAGYWVRAERWTETSRYRQILEAEARSLFEAITAVPDGVLPWLQAHW